MNRIGLAGLSLSFLLLIVAFGFVILGFAANQRASQLVVHTYDVKDVVSHVGRDLERAEAARRGYLLDPTLYRLTTFRETSARLVPSLDQVRFMTADNVEQRQRTDRLKALVEGHVAHMSKTMEMARAGQAEEARRQFDIDSDSESLQEIRSIADSIEDAEDALLTQRLAAERQTLSAIQWLLAGVGLALLIVSLGTMWILRRFTRDLLASRARLHVLNTNLEGAVAERTADLKRANDEIQRFAYIVSHDLRSPLVNVMGFTAELESANKALTAFIADVEEKHPELLTNEARLAASEDLPESIGFIRTSTQKMDRLINAILTLSRQGRRVLTPEHLPMNMIVGEIAASLATLAEERGATIEIDGKLPDLSHDRLAVDQIFQNIIENATKYSRDDVPNVIHVRGKREGSRAIFEIEDKGRGIAPADHERIFDLFRRSGVQDQKGEGIGLAHVRALAYRLGGSVTVRSEIHEGSTFIVDLPIAYQVEGDA
ncbi:histidine kinase [Sphingomonas sp. HDW15A]|nr:histidine kinase [Sphingomonas sp. HDW15A]